LNDNVFVSLQNAKEIIESWRVDYNTARPHSSLNGKTPEEFSRTFLKEQQTEKPKLKLVQ
jgi:putative transposase